MDKPAGPDQTDWFAPAILANGSVYECLDRVKMQLELRCACIDALQKKLQKPGSKVDHISALGMEVKNFIHTLKVRVSLLPKDRAGAWFRAPVATSGGPFAGSVFQEPVFQKYDINELALVREKIQYAWNKRDSAPFLFEELKPNLWNRILENNSRWENLSVLKIDGVPEISLKSETLSLPVEINSPYLHAFLMNVQYELFKVRRSLDQAYDMLWKNCLGFWEWQEQQAKSSTNPDIFRKNLRSDFKDRRSRLLTSRDIESLRILGFQYFPEKTDLKKAYRKLAQKLHPDISGTDGGAFAQLNEAYTYLCQRL